MRLKELKDAGNYEKIYEEYGMLIYNMVTPKSYKEKDIKEIMDRQEYWLIEMKYGPIKCFKIKNFKAYRASQITKLFDEKKFINLEENYMYNISATALANDVYLETGSKLKVIKHESEMIGKCLLKGTSQIALAVGAVSLIYIGFMPLYKDQIYKENAIKHSKLIEKSDQNIDRYVEQLKEGDYTDLEVLVKINNDIITGMKGYGSPYIEIPGYLRVSLLDEDSSGVCRHIADKYTEILNRYNEDWHAYNVDVYMERGEYTEESFNTIKFNSVSRSNNSSQEESKKKKTANHMVTLLTIPDLKYPLIIDPTNPSIGILVEGKIVMLSTETGKGLSYRVISEFMTNSSYCYSAVNMELVKSLFVPFNDKDLAYMIDQYGLEAQKEALDSVILKDLENGKSLKP